MAYRAMIGFLANVRLRGLDRLSGQAFWTTESANRHETAANDLFIVKICLPNRTKSDEYA